MVRPGKFSRLDSFNQGWSKCQHSIEGSIFQPILNLLVLHFQYIFSDTIFSLFPSQNPTKEGYTPLLLAAGNQQECIEILSLLIDAGASLTAKGAVSLHRQSL